MKKEGKLIPENFSSRVEELSRVIGVPSVTHPKGFRVIEGLLHGKTQNPDVFPANQLMFQIIINPWAEELYPAVHVLGINPETLSLDDEESHFLVDFYDSTNRKNNVEGRYFINFHPLPLADKKTINLVEFWENDIFPALRKILGRSRSLNHPKTRGAHNLHYPNCMKFFSESFDEYAKNKNWTLFGEEDSELERKRITAEADTKIQERNTILEKLRMEIGKLSGDEEIIEFKKEILKYKNKLGEELYLLLNQEIEKRAVDLTNDRINFEEHLSKGTPDSGSRKKTRRKARRV